ncbi:SufD family Fe-S cluster assembly protein [Rhodobacter sp. KR11]|uniref:SufB/SufD family protein n=1 Tax=Rhodobacter sp. KR11 TaxID=2974588 RepID=UPI002222A35F|nr:SufD family Fe-S cluster assembly protein [Rhodobacter sp. KR11]MCW1919457.1 SufD family Fe-S cluster assembly protein [Rhodobacter sp. KR11]
MGLIAPKAEALAARLGALTAPKGLDAARARALDRVQAMGLPHRRDEYWRYTDPASLVAPTAIRAEVFDPQDEAAAFDGIDRLTVTFVDGVFAPDLSDDLTLSGVEISRLGAAPDWAETAYGALESLGQSPVARPLAALNTAFATDGLLIRVTGQAARPINLVYAHKSETSDAILHHTIQVDEGCELTLLESGAGAARFNQVLEVELAPRARFHHIRAQGRDHQRRNVTHVFARLGAEALFKSFTLTANGLLTRNEAVITFAGDNARAHIAGAAMGDGAFHHDDTVFITHGAVACESRQVFKKVLKHGAVGVFQGKILVKNGAQKTDGYQISQSLLLDEDSQFLCKPELEIYADDVKCSHGSTSGAIDDTALYYLRSRGVPKRRAQSLLILAFLAEAIQEIADEAIAADIGARLEAWLDRHED